MKITLGTSSCCCGQTSLLCADLILLVMWTTVSRLGVWCITDLKIMTQLTVYTDLRAIRWVVWATVEEICGWVGVGRKGAHQRWLWYVCVRKRSPLHTHFDDPLAPLLLLLLLVSSYFLLTSFSNFCLLLLTWTPNWSFFFQPYSNKLFLINISPFL